MFVVFGCDSSREEIRNGSSFEQLSKQRRQKMGERGVYLTSLYCIATVCYLPVVQDTKTRGWEGTTHQPHDPRAPAPTLPEHQQAVARMKQLVGAMFSRMPRVNWHDMAR